MLPAHCRVQAVLKPSSDSHIEMEVWLPVENWNGKFQAVGNGGWAGNISYPALATALQEGYAAASNDTGHSDAGAQFALNQDKLVDFAYRAMHEMTVQSKTIVGAFYNRPPQLSYYQGCSTGGRQGMMEAQRYPDDFDAIIAGAPVYNMVHLTNWIVNGLPERFPKLKCIWIESGLAWIPFLMQRLDNEYMMRTSECPSLKRLPSRATYMRRYKRAHVLFQRAIKVGGRRALQEHAADARTVAMDKSLIAANEVIITKYTPSVLTWRAASLAQSGQWRTYQGNSDGAHSSMTYIGSQTTADGGYASMFDNRTYQYDDTLQRLRPPFYPILEGSWQTYYWREVTPPA